jgi:hypothetical protein
MLRLSQCVLLAHEDKTCHGAFVASLSIPWGDTKDDSDSGWYENPPSSRATWRKMRQNPVESGRR